MVTEKTLKAIAGANRTFIRWWELVVDILKILLFNKNMLLNFWAKSCNIEVILMAKGWKKKTSYYSEPLKTHVTKEFKKIILQKCAINKITEAEAGRQAFELWLAQDKEGNSDG